MGQRGQKGSSASLCEGADAGAWRVSYKSKILNLEPQMMMVLSAGPTFNCYAFQGASVCTCWKQMNEQVTDWGVKYVFTRHWEICGDWLLILTIREARREQILRARQERNPVSSREHGWQMQDNKNYLSALHQYRYFIPPKFSSYGVPFYYFLRSWSSDCTTVM